MIVSLHPSYFPYAHAYRRHYRIYDHPEGPFHAFLYSLFSRSIRVYIRGSMDPRFVPATQAGYRNEGFLIDDEKLHDLDEKNRIKTLCLWYVLQNKASQQGKHVSSNLALKDGTQFGLK